jgi:tight adherence protein B
VFDFSTLLLMAGLFGTILLGAAAFSGPSMSKAQNRRLENVRERHSKSNEVAAQAQLKRILQNRTETRMDGLAQRFLPKPALLRKRLQQTGKTWTLGQYATGCLGIIVVVSGLLMLRGLPLLLSLMVGLFCGIGVPHWLTGKLIKRRVNKFNVRFPDALELMVRGLRSGLPISETLGIVADEVPGPIADEFRTVSDKMKIGRTMEVALQETADRLGTAEFQFFVITLAIQRETGGNLAETLANLADVLRKRAQMKLKIRAMSSESKASAWIIGSLPFIVFILILIINPGYMGKFFTDQRLIVTGLGGMVWMGVGVFIMAKMIDFEV